MSQISRTLFINKMTSKRILQRWTVGHNGYPKHEKMIQFISESMIHSGRKVPNILVAGTPGCGKTTLCKSIINIISNSEITRNSNFTHYPISELCKSHEWYTCRDDVVDAWILNEKKMLRELKPHIKCGGCIVDFHGCDLFPENWFDLIIILTTNNTILYDRYLERGYNKEKITENIECEIMHVVQEEARYHFGDDRCIILTSDKLMDIESNAMTIYSLIASLIKINKL